VLVCDVIVGGNSVQAVTGSADGHSHEQTAVICPLYQAEPRKETWWASESVCLSVCLFLCTAVWVMLHVQ